MSQKTDKIWVVVPAAGAGRRFGAQTPKQYQLLGGEPIIERTLKKLLALEPDGVIVAIHEADQRWQQLSIASHHRIQRVDGGGERADSVRSGVASLSGEADEDDWVLVHDVARPCVRVADITNLISMLSDHSVGGILATPMSDTVKRVEAHSQIIQTTEDRTLLWAAQTPQLFRYGVLQKALSHAAEVGNVVTDEASAVEALGLEHCVVEGSRDNIKITRREDMAIAEAILAFQADSGE